MNSQDEAKVEVPASVVEVSPSGVRQCTAADLMDSGLPKKSVRGNIRGSGKSSEIIILNYVLLELAGHSLFKLTTLKGHITRLCKLAGSAHSLAPP